MNKRDLLKITGIPVAAASLCCLAPLVLVALGLSTVSFAASLADTFYGTYKWVFRSFGAILLAISIALYIRNFNKTCHISNKKRRRNKILNIIALSVIAAVAGYLFFLYIVVHYAGVWLNIWQ